MDAACFEMLSCFQLLNKKLEGNEQPSHATAEGEPRAQHAPQGPDGGLLPSLQPRPHDS